MRFVPRPKAEYEVKIQPEADAALLMVARAAEVAARSAAPFRSGRYRDGMRSTTTKTPLGYAGIVYNVDYKANWIERGTGPRPDGTVTPAFHTLYNSLRMVGLLTFEVL